MPFRIGPAKRVGYSYWLGVRSDFAIRYNRHMKTTIFGAVFATFMFMGFLMPSTSQALSCLDPASMLQYYTTEDDYIIFTATAGEVKEYVKEAADKTGLDPNMQFDSGYTGQYVEVTEAHKGYPEKLQWVYFEKNSTWGYMCSSGPAEVGQETLYIVSQNHGLFELPRVVNTYPADSALAADIIAALEAAETDNEPMVSEVTTEDWKNRLRTDIVEMIFIVRIKLSEWRWWNTQ